MNAQSNLELMTIPELSAYLKLSRRSLYRRKCDSGFPKPIKLGGAVRYVKRQIDSYLQTLSERQ